MKDSVEVKTRNRILISQSVAKEEQISHESNVEIQLFRIMRRGKDYRTFDNPLHFAGTVRQVGTSLYLTIKSEVREQVEMQKGDLLEIDILNKSKSK